MTRKEELQKKAQEYKALTDPIYKELAEINIQEKKDQLNGELYKLAETKSNVYLLVKDVEDYLMIGQLSLNFYKTEIYFQGIIVNFREEYHSIEDEHEIIFTESQYVFNWSLPYSIVIINENHSIILDYKNQIETINKFLNKNN